MDRSIFENAFDAIRAGNQCAPCGIAYAKGAGWYVYDLRQGIEDINNSAPEFICLGLGKMPVPLTEDASKIISEMLAQANGGARK